MNRIGFLDGPSFSYRIIYSHGEINYENFFGEIITLYCTLKVNPWADSTLCKNQEPTDWYTLREVVMTLMPTAARPGSITNDGTSQDWFLIT